MVDSFIRTVLLEGLKWKLARATHDFRDEQSEGNLKQFVVRPHSVMLMDVCEDADTPSIIEKSCSSSASWETISLEGLLGKNN